MKSKIQRQDVLHKESSFRPCYCVSVPSSPQGLSCGGTLPTRASCDALTTGRFCPQSRSCSLSSVLFLFFKDEV